MQYFVKRGYSYVNPETGAVTVPGRPLCEANIDQSQMWKLETGELAQSVHDKMTVNKKGLNFDEATAIAVENRDKITAARREARSLEQAQQIEESKKVAKKVKSDSVKPKPPVEPDDYKYDEMDEGEE